MVGRKKNIDNFMFCQPNASHNVVVGSLRYDTCVSLVHFALPGNGRP